jgi:acyl carrier protein
MNAQEQVIGIIADKLKKMDADDKTVVGLDSRMADFGDSLVKTEMLMEIEEMFHLPYTPDVEVRKMVTVRDVVNYVERGKCRLCQTPLSLH